MSRPRLFAVAAGLALISSIAVAQGAQTAPRTHTVKRGDTLWDLAKLYLNDAFLWPEIYRVNTDVVEDPHWIYPGEVLRIPDLDMIRRPTPDEVAIVTPPRPAMPETPRPAPAPAPMPPRETSTLHVPVRAGEYLASPFAGPVGGPSGPGSIVGTTDGAGLVSRTHGKMLLPKELVAIEPPVGVRAVRGDRFIAYQLGVMLPGHGQVVEPVGVVQVVAPTTPNGGLVFAEVEAHFREMRVGTALMPIDTLVARRDVWPQWVDNGLKTRVLWIHYDPLLPSLQRYIIIDANAAAGLVTGDQITLVDSTRVDMAGKWLHEAEIAVAQILRVTEQGSSAIIIRHSAPGIETRMYGWLTGRMP
jgi:hypothetical protein